MMFLLRVKSQVESEKKPWREKEANLSELNGFRCVHRNDERS
jgi:hypothetical protein